MNYLKKNQVIKLSSGRVQEGDFVAFTYEISSRTLTIEYKTYKESIMINLEDTKNNVFRIAIFFQGIGSEIKVENIY